MNTNSKLLVYEELLNFLRTPVYEDRISLKAIQVRKLVINHAELISLSPPSVHDLESEYDNIHAYTEPQPGDLTKEIATAAFADLSPQLRSDRVRWLIREYLALIDDPMALLGRITRVKYLDPHDNRAFAEVTIRVSNFDLLKHCLFIPDDPKGVNPRATSAV